MITRETAFVEFLGAPMQEAERQVRQLFEVAQTSPELSPEEKEKVNAGMAIMAFSEYIEQRPQRPPDRYELSNILNALFVQAGVHAVRRFSPDANKPVPVSMYDFFAAPEIATLANFLDTQHKKRTGQSVLDILKGAKRLLSPTAQMIGEQFQTTIRKVYHDATFLHSGQKIYEPSPGLSEKLLHTDIRGLRVSDVQLPFPAFYIVVPKRLGFKVFNRSTGYHPMRGIYISQSPAAATKQGMEIAAHKGDAEESGWRILIWGESKNPADPWDDALDYCALHLPGEMTMDDAVRYSVAHNVMHEETATGKVLKWLINLIVYATWPDAEVEHVIMNPVARSLWERHTKAPKGSEKRQRLLKEYRRISNPNRRIVLGRSVTVLDAERAIEHREGKPVTIRTLVQGHWRHYWVGSGRTERVRKWIQPFWRGPLDGPVGPNVHKLV